MMIVAVVLLFAITVILWGIASTLSSMANHQFYVDGQKGSDARVIREHLASIQERLESIEPTITEISMDTHFTRKSIDKLTQK